MECYYHPERESTDTCAICGKSICKECGLEIAGKIYCKECLEKIVGLGIDNKANAEPEPAAAAEPIKTEPARLDKQPADENIYQPQAEEPIAPQQEAQPAPEIRPVSDDSPYNIKDTAYSEQPESSYLHDSEIPAQEPVAEPQIPQQPTEEPQIAQQPVGNSQEFIYPDHSYEPEPTSARVELEDKYEKYLDDLYFDEKEVPLGEQLAKDEEQYGSLTRRPYKPRPEESVLKEKAPKMPETPEEMEARIRAEILAEKEGRKPDRSGIHKMSYDQEDESMGVVDIILTIILVIIILVVIYYLIYIFVLHATYPTFMDAIYALSNPQNVINNIISPPAQV